MTTPTAHPSGMNLVRSAVLSMLAVAAACGRGDGSSDDHGASSSSVGASSGSVVPTSDTGAPTGGNTDDTGVVTGPDGGSSSSGGTSGDGGHVNPNPTISAYVGTNVGADLWAADFGWQLNGFDGTLDANGLPATGQSGTSQTDVGFLFPGGTYEIVWEGTGTVSVGGIGTLHDVTDDGDVHRGAVDLVHTPGEFGKLLTVTITNGPGQSVTSLHLYPPGVDPSASFYPPFLAALTPFRALRFMDWEATNGSTLVSWADRPTSARFGAQAGVPYELIVALINETGKDAWLTMPEKVDDDFITQMAQFFAQELDLTRIQSARDAAGFTTPFRLYVENSNETWNTGFSAYTTFLTAASADPGRYTGETRGTYGPDFMNDNVDLMPTLGSAVASASHITSDISWSSPQVA